MRRHESTWQEQQPDDMVTWRPIEPAQPVEGPLALDLFVDRLLVLELASDQLAFRECGGRLQQAYFDGVHQLQVGHGTELIPPSSRLFFLRTGVPLTWRWRDKTSLRVDTGGEPGILIPLRGVCSLVIDDPVGFYENVLQGLESCDTAHLVNTLDTLVRSQIAGRLETLIERAALDPLRVQILLNGLAATDLDEDLHELGLRCIHLAAGAPMAQDEPVAPPQPVSTLSGSYDDVF